MISDYHIDDHYMLQSTLYDRTSSILKVDFSVKGTYLHFDFQDVWLRRHNFFPRDSGDMKLSSVDSQWYRIVNSEDLFQFDRWNFEKIRQDQKKFRDCRWPIRRRLPTLPYYSSSRTKVQELLYESLVMSELAVNRQPGYRQGDP